MSNPFGDCDDEEYDRFQAKNDRKPAAAAASSNLNPFGDLDDHTNIENNAQNSSDFNDSFRALSAGGSKPIYYSRQSLDSNQVSDNQSIYSNSYIGSYTMGEGSVEKEGLFCPECFEEFRQITDMIEHAEKFHSPNSSANNSKSSQLKGFLTKIKTKAQIGKSNFDNSESIDERNFDPSYNPTEDWKQSMKLGPKRSHFSEFKKVREIRIERFVLETNKLLIRLDKLLRDYPFDSDANERRLYEQSIVTWIDDNLVDRCPTCTFKFNFITRKKHHCRLCGSVMCTKCSQYMTFEDCYKLVSSIGVKIDPRKQRLSVTASSGKNLLSKIAISSPIANDFVGQFDTKLDSLRICYECEKLMLRRLEKIEKSQIVPSIIELYSQLEDNRSLFDRQLETFKNIAQSISNGNPTHSQADLHNAKTSLTKTGEILDIISKKIELLNLLPAKKKAEMDPIEVQRLEPSQKQQNLQRNIRRATILYLKRLQHAHSVAIQSVQQ